MGRSSAGSVIRFAAIYECNHDAGRIFLDLHADGGGAGSGGIRVIGDIGKQFVRGHVNLRLNSDGTIQRLQFRVDQIRHGGNILNSRVKCQFFHLLAPFFSRFPSGFVSGIRNNILYFITARPTNVQQTRGDFAGKRKNIQQKFRGISIVFWRLRIIDFFRCLSTHFSRPPVL